MANQSLARAGVRRQTALRGSASTLNHRRSSLGNSLFFALFVIANLAGCGYAPTKGTLTGAELLGPITKGRDRAPVLGGCRQTPLFAGTCDLIFTDLHGSHIDGHRLARDLDQAAKHVPPLSGWLSPDLNDESKLPYELHLLTISPAIVLAVPASSRRTRCSSVYDQGCIQSQGFRGQAYWYRAAPAVREGSFWFAANGGAYFPLDRQSDSARIVTNGAVIELVAERGTWIVQRTK